MALWRIPTTGSETSVSHSPDLTSAVEYIRPSVNILVSELQAYVNDTEQL